MMFPGLLDISKFIVLNLNLIGLFVCISFFFSCIADETKTAVLFGTGVPVLFFVVNMLKEANDKLTFLKYFTIFSLFNTSLAISKDMMVYLNMALLYVGGLMLYGLGIYIF